MAEGEGDDRERSATSDRRFRDEIRLAAAERLDLEGPPDWCCGVRHAQVSPRDFSSWEERVTGGLAGDETWTAQDGLRRALVDAEYFQLKELKAMEPHWRTGIWIVVCCRMNITAMNADAVAEARWRGYLTQLMRLLVVVDPVEFIKVEGLRYFFYAPRDKLWEVMDMMGKISRILFKFRFFCRKLEPTMETDYSTRLNVEAGIGIHEGEALLIRGDAFGTAVERAERMALSYTRRELMEQNRNFVVMDDWMFTRLLREGDQAEMLFIECVPCPSDVYILDKCTRTMMHKMKGVSCSMRMLEEAHRLKSGVKMGWPDVGLVPAECKPEGFLPTKSEGLIFVSSICPAEHDRFKEHRPTYFKNLLNGRHLFLPLVAKHGGQTVRWSGGTMVAVFDNAKLNGRALHAGFDCARQLRNLVDAYNFDRSKANMVKMCTCMGWGPFCINGKDVSGKEVDWCIHNAEEVAGCGSFLNTESLQTACAQRQFKREDWVSDQVGGRLHPRCSGACCGHPDDMKEDEPPDDIERSEPRYQLLIFLDREFASEEERHRGRR